LERLDIVFRLVQNSRMRALSFGLFVLTTTLSLEAAAAPPAGGTTQTSFEVTASLSLGQLKPLRVQRARVGVGILAFQNGNDLVVRRLATLPTMTATTTLTSKLPGKALELLELQEDVSGNLFVLHRTGSELNTTRLVKIDPQGQVAFDLAVFANVGCYKMTPDDAGGLYVASYAPKLASGVSINVGRPRVSRISPTGATLWENVAASDYTYKGNKCAIAKSAGGAYAAFTVVAPNGPLDGPADVHLVSLNSSGLSLSVADKVAGFTAANPLTGQPVQISLQLDVLDLWDFNGPVLLGKTVQGAHHLVRYDTQSKVVAATAADPMYFSHKGALYYVTNNATSATVHKVVPGAASFAKSDLRITDVASKPAHVFTGSLYDGNGMLVFYGKQGTFPAMGFARLDGTKLGSAASGMGAPFVDPFESILVAGGKFFLVDRAAQSMATSGNLTLPMTAVSGTLQPLSTPTVAAPIVK
jgi:hypothetical protein